MADICPFFGVVLSNWEGRFAPTSQLAQNHPKKGANIGRRFAAASLHSAQP
jgi:hypothetical protein